MKKFIITLLTLFTVGAIAVGALAVRIYRNFTWLDESGLEEKDVVYLEYDGVRYIQHELNESTVSEWTDENLFRVGMDINFPCGDALKVTMDQNGTKWSYTLFGCEVDITKFVQENTEVEHNTVFEEVHSIT